MRAASERHRRERGAVVVIVALVLTVLLGFVGFVLNAGHATSVRGELQNASDAAALAAARELNGQSSGVGAARRVAADFAALHSTDTTRSVDISSTSDVQFCSWDVANRSLNWCLPPGTDPTLAQAPPPLPAGITQLEATNAVRVLDGREASRSNALPVWLSAFLGNTTSMDVRAGAIAVGGGPSTPPAGPCIPLAFADCILVDPAGGLNCNRSIVFHNDFQDNAGFTCLLNPNTNTSCLRSLLSGGRCQVSVGQVISIENGSNFHPLYNGFQALLGGTYWAPVVHPAGCEASPPDPKFNQDYAVLGFVQLTIDYVGDVGPNARCGGSGPCVIVTMQCPLSGSSVPAGGSFFGLPTYTSQLVQ